MPNIKKMFQSRQVLKIFRKGQGQSLVELAIVAPLLIFIFLGLIEVGWALRGQLTLQTANRETARFAARGEYLNFDKVAENIIDIKTEVGYNIVLSHTEEILANNYLGLDINATGASLSDPNGSVILAHFLVDTGYPCRQSSPTDDCAASCASGNYYTLDDLVLHPGVNGYEHFSYTEGISATASRLDYEAIAAELIKENNELNCSALARSPLAELSVNSVVVSEAFYEQSQILGFPLISNQLTDPVPLYNQTMMRISPQNGLSQGEGCELLPVAIQQDAINAVSQGDYLNNISEGTGSGQFGWLRWRKENSDAVSTGGSTDTAQYLEEEILNLRLSLHDYINPNNSDDTVLNAGNAISWLSGNVVTGDVRDALDTQIGRTVSVPVFSAVNGTGSNATYNTVGFVYLRITEVSLTGNPKTISGQYLGPNLNCPTSEFTSPTSANPIANDDGPTNIVQGGQLPINVIANDTHVTPNMVTITSAPSVGSISNYDNTTGVFTYQAPASIGSASVTTEFTYEACNSENICDSATVTIIVTQVTWTATPTPAATDTSTATATPTNTPAATATPTNTPVPTATSTPTPTNTPSPTPTPAISVIAWDNFESNSWSGGSGWSGNWYGAGDVTILGYDNGNPYEGSRQLRARGNTSNYLQRDVNLSGLSSAELSFAWRARSFEGSERARIWIYDGGWHIIFTASNGDDDNNWHVAQIDLSGYNLTSNFTIYIEAGMQQSNRWRDEFYIDDIEITGG